MPMQTAAAVLLTLPSERKYSKYSQKNQTKFCSPLLCWCSINSQTGWLLQTNGVTTILSFKAV